MTNQPPVNNEILRIAQQFKDALARHDKQALNRLIDAYERIYARLQDKINLLIDAIEMTEPTGGQLVRMERYIALIHQVENELHDYQAILRNEIENSSRDAIAFAGRDTARLLRAYGVSTRFNRLPNEVIRTLLGFLSEDGPLFKRISQLAAANAQYVADKILEGVSLGQGPRVIAGIIRDALGGGLTDALRMTRTIQIWSYREASRANYLANSDIVGGWIWYSARDDRTCEACLAMDGTIHGLDESLDGHYNCRCTPLPIVEGLPNPLEQTGEQWFNDQSDAYQRETLGPGKYDAWKAGQFEFNQLATSRPDEVYGNMIVAAALKDLIGSE
jgi:SPP1 gp7 family putative phage head morphogenesis protein